LYRKSHFLDRIDPPSFVADSGYKENLVNRVNPVKKVPPQAAKFLRILSFEFRAMKLFSFRLDSILNYRNYLEKRAQRNLVNAINEYIGWEREIDRLSKRRIEIARKCSDEGFRGMDVPKYHMYRSFLQKVNDDLERANMCLKRTEEKIKEKKAVLKGESIKKKTLETLKDLQLKKYMHRLETEEQKTIDELVIMRKEGRA